MIPVEEALARLLAPLQPVGTEQVSVMAALGRVLAEDVVARRTQPPFNASAMDGYAVRSADVGQAPTRLRVIGSVPAGEAFTGRVGPGEAVRIFTGAPVPADTDSIVLQEDTERAEDDVIIKEVPIPGRWIRPAGLDFRKGDVGLRAGIRLNARDIGLAAAMNRPFLSVHRRPRVAILPTGNEIVMPGDPIGHNQIVSSNGIALAAFVTALGGDPILLGIAPDDADALRTIAASVRGADLLITTGGASVGEHDLVKDALGAAGLALDFWKIAMRPGKPLMFGNWHGTPMIGLPGNPVSAFVCAQIFVKPALERLLGMRRESPPFLMARLTVPLRENDRRQDYLRAKLVRTPDGDLDVTPFDKQDSSMLSLLAHADCLVIRRPFAPAATKGSRVPVLLFD